MEVQCGVFTQRCSGGGRTRPRPSLPSMFPPSLPRLVPSSGKIIFPSLMPCRACAQCAAPCGTPNPTTHSLHSHKPTCRAGENVLWGSFCEFSSYIRFTDFGYFDMAEKTLGYSILPNCASISDSTAWNLRAKPLHTHTLTANYGIHSTAFHCMFARHLTPIHPQK